MNITVITWISIGISIIYLIILIIKGIPIKKLFLNLIITIIFVLIVYLINYLFIKPTSKENNNTTTTTIKSTIESNTSTTTTEKPTTTTKTTTKTTTTSNNSNLTSKGYKIEYKNGAYYIDNYLIVNKTYQLSSDWVPTNTYKEITKEMDGFCRNCIDKEAYKAWLLMQADASTIGYNMWIQSGYRGYYYQQDLYNGYVKRKGQAAADKSSARPGASEHQSGLAFDICVKDASQNYPCISSDFNNTAPALWLKENAYKYGYILRYPEGKTSETGYIYESWHYRYVGTKLAKALYNDGNWLTMEDYFGIESKYTN